MPVRPHHVCANCGHYRGREVEPLRRGRALARGRRAVADVTIAVDAMGGDRAPAEIVAGAVDGGPRRACACCCAAPAERAAGAGRRTDRRRDGGGRCAGCDRLPRRAGAGRPRQARLVAGHRLPAGREGRARGRVSAGSTGAMLAASLLLIGRIPGIAPAGHRRRPARPGRALLLIDCRRQRRGRGRAPAAVRRMGSIFAERRARHRAAAGRAALDRRGGVQGHRADARRRTRCWRRPSSTSRATARAATRSTGEFQVIVADGFAGQRAPEGPGGRRRRRCSPAARGRRRRASGRSSAGCCCVRRCAAMRTRTDPEIYGGAYLLGVRGLSVIAHGNSSRPRSATPSLRRPRRRGRRGRAVQLARTRPPRTIPTCRTAPRHIQSRTSLPRRLEKQ